MFDKPQASHVLGLDLDTFSLKGVAIASSRGKPKLESFFDYPTQPDPIESNPDNVKPLYTNEQQTTLKELIDSHLVVTAIETRDIILRPLEFKIKKEKDIDSILAFQAEPILPYPTENSILDKILLSRSNGGSKITLAATRKDYLSGHLQQWNSIWIEPEVVTIAPLALALFAKEFAPTVDSCYILHLGWTHSLCTLIENGKPTAAQAIAGGVAPLAEIIAREQNIDFAIAKQHLCNDQFLAARSTAGFRAAADGLRSSITRTVYSLAKQIKGREVASLLITGPGATIPGFASTIVKNLNKSLLEVSDDPSFGMESHNLLNFALPIGQALSCLSGNADQINFRQGDYAFPSPWKRLKIPIGIYITLCLAAAFALTIYGQAAVKHQEGIVKLQYLDLLAGMNRSYPDFERDYANKAKVGKRDLAPGEIISINELTPEEIRYRLQYLEKEIQAIPQTFPLQPNTPLVSDVLAWISTHPAFVGINEKNTKGDMAAPLSQTLQIETFQYVMVKRPDPTKKQEKYQVKVELEFSSPTPKMAREFHDALIAPNDIVDPKAEIKWNSNRDKYRTSFFLKDKTAYPAP